MIKKLWKYKTNDSSIKILSEEIKRNISKNYTEICTSCGQYFGFDETDINKENPLLKLPHIWCPTCGKMLQLPSKYLTLMKREQTPKARLMSLYGETNCQSQSY